MLGEIIVFAMLKDEDASFVEIVAIQNEVWNLRQLLQSVWRIGKDKVKLLLAGLQKTEYITEIKGLPFDLMALYLSK